MNKDRNFLLSKQVSKEDLNFLYKDNVELHLHRQGDVYLLKNVTEGNRRRMCYLLLIAQLRDVSQLGKLLDNALWTSIPQTLKGLHIVAEQPVHASSY